MEYNLARQLELETELDSVNEILEPTNSAPPRCGYVLGWLNRGLH